MRLLVGLAMLLIVIQADLTAAVLAYEMVSMGLY